MTRSLWKGPFFEYKALKLICKANLNKKPLKLASTHNLIILPIFMNLSFLLYDGKSYFFLKITELMLGFKLKQFVITKKKVFHKKK